jgi:hypothetical protein
MGLLHCNRQLPEGKLRIIAAFRPRELQVTLRDMLVACARIKARPLKFVIPSAARNLPCPALVEDEIPRCARNDKSPARAVAQPIKKAALAAAFAE